MICTVCASPAAASIDQLLVAGRSRRSLAAENGLGYDSLKRHARHHLLRPLGPDTPAPSAAPPGDPANPYASLLADLKVKALTSNNPAHIRELRLVIKEAADWENAQPKEEVDLSQTAAWAELRELMWAALQPIPGALAAIQAAIDVYQAAHPAGVKEEVTREESSDVAF